jgi:CheY-like chemotaxis protein
MPVMDGNEATRKIRASSKGDEVMIIALTASAFDKESDVSIEAGMNDFLCKPFKVEELFAKIKKHLPVEYIYEKGQDVFAQAKAETPLALSSEMLLRLPADILANIRQATFNGDIEQLKKQIVIIADIDRSLANALMALADLYEYDKLLELLEISKEPILK